MKIAITGVKLIQEFEGLELKAYKCPAGVWTIGYGHTKGVKQGDVITPAQATAYLQADLADAEKAVNSQNLKISQNQYDALVSFTFNVGTGNFLKSTLLKKVKINPDETSIRSEFAKWKYGSGKVLPGLVCRREAEANLYFKK
ncbi:lysozyme [Dysgonomonas capnocytophagoides]|uniref:lysozyme n=1 Tax=Dysgonomonas capnocytophagoides TaxID=45254 RepID=UPI00333F5C96